MNALAYRRNVGLRNAVSLVLSIVVLLSYTTANGQSKQSEKKYASHYENLIEIAESGDSAQYSLLIEEFENRSSEDYLNRYKVLQEVSKSLGANGSRESFNLVMDLMRNCIHEKGVPFGTLIPALSEFEKNSEFQNELVDEYSSILSFTINDRIQRPQYNTGRVANRLAEMAKDNSMNARQELAQIVSGDLNYQDAGEFTGLAARLLREVRYSDGIIEIYESFLNNPSVKPVMRDYIAQWLFGNSRFGYSLEERMPELPSVENVDAATAQRLLNIIYYVSNSDFVTEETLELFDTVRPTLETRLNVPPSPIHQVIEEPLPSKPEVVDATVAVIEIDQEDEQAAPRAPEPASPPAPAREAVPWWPWALGAVLLLLIVVGLMVKRK